MALREMFTNQDAQDVINSNAELSIMLKELKKVQPGSGEILIHQYALKRLLEELAAYRGI